ncbi:MAG: UDP-N-acetylmuramoyl-tripeptide--D-alanyl-D-alanine ligase, partial [Actinomycetota bacterium]|nr:UDP-N-acetylmuramoyl-tripeptide--D-alanyl-D-alanine ligase [Actinomycetota bacterium]
LLSEIAADVGGPAGGSDVEVSSAVVDSREAVPGALFVAIRGERTDGHRYMEDAFAAGCSAALVERAPGEHPHVLVDDTQEAFLSLAGAERRAMNASVLAITGANGKTSTKDLAAGVLGTRLRVHASPASYNNEVGVPLTILGAAAATEALVCELGARHLDEHTRLCSVVDPDVVVVTNAGVAHMQEFGSWENIVAATAEPVDALSAGAIAILNADDPTVSALASRTRAEVLTFGLARSADVCASDIQLDVDGRARFTLSSSGDRERVELAVPGEHMVSNALAAAACGLALGLSVAECATGLKDAGVSRWRMEPSITPSGVRVLNDAYNANPDSVGAGLKAARWIARDARLVAVLGHMAELGPISAEEHEAVGRLVTRLGIERLVTVGEEAEAIARSAVREGMEPDAVETVSSAEAAAESVRSWARAGDVVFLKGSRVAGLERVAELLA